MRLFFTINNNIIRCTFIQVILIPYTAQRNIIISYIHVKIQYFILIENITLIDYIEIFETIDTETTYFILYLVKKKN